jgi:hypothetical protein
MRAHLFAGIIVVAACGQPVRVVNTPLAVRVINPPVAVHWTPHARVDRSPPQSWTNQCEAIPRLSPSETRLDWVRRIGAYVQERALRVGSVTIAPSADGTDIALVCFSTPS